MARRFTHDPSIVFLLVGDGPLADTVDAEIDRIDIKNIIRHSFYNPSSDVFAVSDVVVLPSEYEGMPMVILEAQSMGVPVVVTNVGNNQEVLDITHGGVVVSHIGDIAALVNGVQAMLENPPDSDVLRQSIIDHFSLVKMGEDYRKALLG
jgi:glycosyltransferase involved in cell wall biosynthesis